MGYSQKEQVIFNRRTGPPLSVTTGITQWVTAIECICADGPALTPLVIHRGQVPQQPMDRWFPASQHCPNWYTGFSTKGWSSNDLALEWLQRIFLPETTKDDEWRCLILDGHNTHYPGEFQWECINNRVVVVYLLPHMSHLIQPCDMGPFSQLKRHYARRLKDFTPQGSATINQAQFNLLYQEARSQSFTKQYYQAGWSRTGIYPWNPSRIINHPII